MRNAFILHGRAEKFRAEKIFAEKLTRLRMALAEKAAHPELEFTRVELEAFVKKLMESVPDSSFIETESGNVFESLKDRKAIAAPDLSRPELQLLWAAAIVHIQSDVIHGGGIYSMMSDINKKNYIGRTKLWEQITESPDVIRTLQQYAIYINEELRRDDAKFSWGVQGSGFKYNTDENAINIDLVMSLVSGMEHAQSIMFREIGKAQLSTIFPEKNRKIRDQMFVLKEKQKRQKNKLKRDLKNRGGLSDGDYKKLRKLGLEWEMRKMLWAAAEKCATNRYAEHKGKEKSQEYAYSLNHFLMTNSHFGLNFIHYLRNRGVVGAAENENSPEKRFINILNAIELSFFKNNGLFDSRNDNWEKFGVHPSQIKITKENYVFGVEAEIANDNHVGGVTRDFKCLLDMCDKLENIQPRSSDRWCRGKVYFNSLTDLHSMQRNEIIEEIWDLYLEDIANELLNNLDQDIEQELGNDPQQDNEQQEESEEEQSGGQEDSPQEQSGQESNSQGDPSQGDPSQGDEQPEQEENQKSEDQMPEDFDPDEQFFGDKEEDKSSDEQEFDSSEAGVDKDGGTIDVDNNDGETKDMPDVDLPPENPEGQEPGQDKDTRGLDDDGQDKEGADGKTLEQIKKELEDALKKMQEEMEAQQDQEKGKEGQEADGQGKGEKGEGDSEGDEPSEGAGDGGGPKTIEDIACMEWTSYPALIAELRSYISKTAAVLRQIRDVQIEKTIKRSPDLEMLPEGKEMDRLDGEAHRNWRVKFKSGTAEKDDLNRFQKNERDNKPTTIDMVLLIDGSGSMIMDSYKLGKATPMEISLLSGIVLYEAAKEIGANVYIVLWGSDDPIVLAKPGDDSDTVEKNIMKAKKGMNCGTNLAPSIKKIAKVLSDYKSSQYSGYTHMMVLSDGDISDPDESVKAIHTLLSSTEYVTLEFAVMKKLDGIKTQMENVAKRVKAGNPTQKIGVLRGDDPNSVPAGIVGLIFQKIRMLKSFTAVPWAKKRKLFQRVNMKFGMK